VIFEVVAFGDANAIVSVVLADFDAQIGSLDGNHDNIPVGSVVWYKLPTKVLEEKSEIRAHLFSQLSFEAPIQKGIQPPSNEQFVSQNQRANSNQYERRKYIVLPTFPFRTDARCQP
jgi:hypothetical protein